jgi:hypothetical protein
MSGIRNIKSISKKYKEAEIYFHIDLDGVFSFLAMKKYLEDNNIKVCDAHVIQYGSLEFNVKNTKQGRLPVIVDFAHVKDIFVIATDHHDNQAGANSAMSTSFKKSQSNAETISGEIHNDVFVFTDIELVKTVDSADYLKYGIKLEQIQKSIFNYNPNFSPDKNRFLLGLVVNRLLLSLKNKRIKIGSLNGYNEHLNRNLIECLVLDSQPSLYSLYLNIRHYIDNAVSYEWNKDLKSYHDPKKLPTQKQLNFNLGTYINSRKEFVNNKGVSVKNKELSYDPEYKIITQFDIGKTFDTGSYDRYVVFRNFPDADWVCTIYGLNKGNNKMGLIQVAANPFKEKTNNIHLGNITKELFEKYRDILSWFRISLGSIKRLNEDESYKLKQKYSNYAPIGFKFNDLMTFYKDFIYYLPNRSKGDFKTISKLDLSDNNNPDVKLLKTTMNKLYTDWTFEEKQEMNLFKIPGLNILEVASGGHPSITNIQGLNFLDERRDAIQRYFGKTVIPVYNFDGSVIHKYIQTYDDLMVFFSNEFLSLLKQKLKGNNEQVETDIVLLGNSSENIG